MNKRIFLAIPLPDELRQTVREFQGLLRTYYGKRALVSWVQEDALHVTMNFFGMCTEAQQIFVRDRLSVMIHPLHETLRTDRLMAFPDMRSPKIISLTCDAESDVLGKLQAAIEECVAEIDIAPALHAWMPHITIGRVHGALHKPWPKISFEPQSFPVSGFTLFESELSPRGPVYTALETFPRA